MFSGLLPYKTLAEAIAVLAAVVGLVYGVHQFLEHERDIGYQKAVTEYTAKALDAEKAARNTETDLRNQLEAAQNAATAREQVIRSTAAAAAAASGSLHDALATLRNGVPSASADALGKSVTTLATVLDACQRRYTEVAEDADRHASDTKTMTDAWPKDRTKNVPNTQQSQ